MKVIKFGGKSLGNGGGIDRVLSIIQKEYQQSDKFAVVVSARGDATNQLIELIDLATSQSDYSQKLEEFKAQQQLKSNSSLDSYFQKIEQLLHGVQLIGVCPPKTWDSIVAHGEIISANYLVSRLSELGIPAVAVDSGDLFVTDSNFGQAQAKLELSEEKTKAYFQSIDEGTVAIVTGFIAKDTNGERTTLGRNGSNYSAALLANFLDADLLENFTHVDGIFTGNPDDISEATKINQLSYSDASELAQFGTNILHINTIEPLQKKNIPLRILNTFNPNDTEGTLISANPDDGKVRALACLKNKALVHFEGKGLLGKIGVDARIFNSFQKANISVGMISQGSSERGIALVVDECDAEKAVQTLQQTFKEEADNGDIIAIKAEKGLGVLAIIGMPLNELNKPFKALVRNHITPILLNNTTTGNTVCMLLKQRELSKAIQIIHGELFDLPKKIHLALVGHGLVGKTLIDQILKQQETLQKNKKIDLRIFAIANSRKLLLDANGVGENWKEIKENQKEKKYTLEDIIEFANQNKLENLILVDNTASKEIAQTYAQFAKHGFDIVSSNKIANTLSYEEYQSLRKTLDSQKKKYYYETNVGAGLPLIDTIKLLHLSGENITRIKGVFSGSLSYLFNHFSLEDTPFSKVLEEAKRQGYTEPDPREDLCGNDVARKLLILARELELSNELEDVKIQNLIPESLRAVSQSDFFERIEELDDVYSKIKNQLNDDQVLRYVGDLQYNPTDNSSSLEVKLIQVSKSSALGQVKGADSIFEIYTESYGNHPLVIQGAGAGAQVTARGVFGDILRLSELRD